MPEQTYQEVVLSEISPSPFNPRKRFGGKKFDELVISVREKGIIEPILIRPVAKGKTPFEIVAGERRWRAKCQVASENGGIEKNAIPALLRELSDDDAFDLMTIENLQREDLTELEEAEGFKAYIDRHGKESASSLAERTGIDVRYIRRRLRLLSLPARILKDWEAGRLAYGHLEQLMRVDDKKARAELHKEALGNGHWKPSVKDIKRQVDNMSPGLGKAPFDLEKEGCVACSQNSDVQKKLWELDAEKTLCHNPKCFKKKVNNHLLKNFKRTTMHQKHKVKGFRFKDDLSYDQYENFDDLKPAKKCFECEHFVSLVDTYGTVERWFRRACVGKKACFNEVEAAAKKAPKRKPAASSSGADSGEGPEAPRVAWHGQYFREKFFKTAIPEKYRDFHNSKFYMILFAIFEAERDIGPWFAEKLGISVKENQWWDITSDAVWKAISTLDPVEASDLIDEAALQIIMLDTFGADNRRRIADHIGIDLASEWAMDEEYLSKKTVPEIMAIGETLGIFSDKKAQEFLVEELKKKSGKYGSCKKPELIRLVLESGVDLVGKVPAEILADK